MGEKILEGTLDEIIENKAYKTIFPHNTSHWIGMDVNYVGNQYELNVDSKICMANIMSWYVINNRTRNIHNYIMPSVNITNMF